MAMSATRRTQLVVLVLLTACRDEIEPVPLYAGEWIDIGGIGRERSDTCVGTFHYVDAYAGALVAEFRVNGPVGSYIWYSPEDYDALHPCPFPYPSACAGEDTVHSPFFPQEHEIVHVTHHHRSGWAPPPLAEGIAVYYSTEINEGKPLDVDALARRLASPTAGIPLEEYEMLGRFAGFLIERHGLDAVLEVCAAAGREASGGQLSAAMHAILGETPEELLAALSQEPTHCNDFDIYRSNVFACGVAAAAPSLGSFVDGHLEARLEFHCEQPDTVGPFEAGTFYGRMVRMFRLDLPTNDVYVFRVRDETQADEPIPNGLTMRASQCRPCGDWVWADSDVDGSFPSIAGLDAGRYSVEITMPEDYVGAVRLEIDL
jgi:hypothetical protein